MIRSMTGYGEAEAEAGDGRIRVEIRSVNHRHFRASLRMPDTFSRWEAEVRERLRGSMARGHVSCTVRLSVEDDALEAGTTRVRLDGDRVRAYLALYRELADSYGVPGTPDLAVLARQSDIFVREEPDSVLPTVDQTGFLAVVGAAAEQTVRMREREGVRLREDLEGRLARIAEALRAIRERAPVRLRSERDRLREAVRKLTDDVEVDEDRLSREVAYLAERWDINEELVRFDSHLSLFAEDLGRNAAEPVGKRLAFLVQEMHREGNTIGSKANDAEITHRVVDIKDEVERLREQVENVE